MIGNEGKTAGPDSQDNYESAVLDFLDREMAAVQSAQKGKEQSDELDALVSDLLNQVLAESDQPQTDNKAPSEGMDDIRLNPMLPQKDVLSSENKNVRPDLEPRSSWAEVRDELLAEFLTPQEGAPPSENKNARPDSGPEPGSFEDMDAVLAQYMLPREGASSAETKLVPSDPIPQPGQSENLKVLPAKPMPPKEETTPSENKNVPLNPDPAAAKAERPHLAVDTQKPKADIQKPETGSAAVLKSPAEKAASAKTSSTKATSKPAAAIFAASDTPKSKAPLIAVAVICLLAAVGIPIYFFTGSSSNVSKTTQSQPTVVASPPAAASQAVTNDRVPAVPLFKVAPKNPDFSIKGRASASVVLELSIDSDGNVVKAIPVSGPELFYNAAIDAAMQWRFKPASVAGGNVPSRSRITFYFNLKN